MLTKNPLIIGWIFHYVLYRTKNNAIYFQIQVDNLFTFKL
jgi:hypothetical protein